MKAGLAPGPASPAPTDAAGVPMRLPPWVWVAIAVGFAIAYGIMFTVVHVAADTRPCVAQLPDPLFGMIRYDPRWFYFSHQVYYVFTFGGLGALFYGAIRHGNHAPLGRFAAGLSIQAALRCATVILLPICRATVAPGTIVLAEVPTLDLYFFQVPWRLWAVNDLIFSGHVGEFLLMFWATRHWPRWSRVSLVVFQVLQAYALLATRGHYLIDILLAIPCAYMADGVSVWLLSHVGRRARARAVATTTVELPAPGAPPFAAAAAAAGGERRLSSVD